MSEQTTRAKLVFHFDFDERTQVEAHGRGYLTHVSVELADGNRYAVTFYDPVRLRQDLEEMARWGKPYVGEPGMIVVPEVTVPYMETAVTLLESEGFFLHLKPMRVSTSGTYEEWPPPQTAAK